MGRLRWNITFALALTGHTAAQQQTITVQNLAPFARREWTEAVIPFAKGAVRGTPDLHVEKRTTVWQPFGANWDDGSLRQALCLFPVEMKALSELSLKLVAGAGPKIPKLEMSDPLRDGKATVSIEVTVAGKTERARPAYVRDLESNPARRVSLYRCRVGTTGILFEFIVTTKLGQAHCDASLGVFFSDPGTKALEVRFDRIAVVTTGQQFVPHHAGRFAMTAALTAKGSTTTLLGRTSLGDGQGIRRVGVLVPHIGNRRTLHEMTVRAAAVCPILAATSWQGTDAYGPYGVIPEVPKWLRGKPGRAVLARRHAAFVSGERKKGDPFRRYPFALVKDPGAMGDQNDFGLLKLAPVVSTGLPSFLLEVQPSVLQEACRPVHFFEADGSPVLASKHPDWVQWDGRTHWHCDVSKDRLGKPCPQPKFNSHGWKGKDRQHWSSNYLCGYYLLTGAPWARREIENEVQLFLAGQTIRGGIATTGPGAPRAVGRMLRLGCWLYQCTGDEALVTRMRARMKTSYLPGWSGRKLAKGRVRPMAIRGPSGRSLDGKTKYWTPWEDCIAATGLIALHRLTGDETAWQLAEAISMNALRHGWLVDGRSVRVGYQIPWLPGGQPLPRDMMVSKNKKIISWAGGGIALWSMGAVDVALHFAKARGDQAMVEKAEFILRRLRAGRDRAPADGWWGELAEWDAIRVGR